MVGRSLNQGLYSIVCHTDDHLPSGFSENEPPGGACRQEMKATIYLISFNLLAMGESGRLPRTGPDRY